MIRHALTFDVEDWYQGFVQRNIDGWQNQPPRDQVMLEKILALLEAHRVKATFFVLGKFAEKNNRLVKLLSGAGHEIASHSYAHQALPMMSPGDFREDLHRSIALLEDQTGRKVKGYRAPRWSMNRRSAWTLAIMAEQGLLYDSSVYPTAIHTFGLPESPTRPFRWMLSGGRSIVELPAQVWKLGPLRIPAAGGFYLRALPLIGSRMALQQSERDNAGGMVYLHPYDLDPTVPRIKAPLAFRFVRYYHLGKTESYLDSLLKRFRFSTAGELLEELGPALPTLPVDQERNYVG